MSGSLQVFPYQFGRFDLVELGYSFLTSFVSSIMQKLFAKNFLPVEMLFW